MWSFVRALSSPVACNTDPRRGERMTLASEAICYNPWSSSFTCTCVNFYSSSLWSDNIYKCHRKSMHDILLHILAIHLRLGLVIASCTIRKLLSCRWLECLSCGLDSFAMKLWGDGTSGREYHHWSDLNQGRFLRFEIEYLNTQRTWQRAWRVSCSWSLHTGNQRKNEIVEHLWGKALDLRNANMRTTLNSIFSLHHISCLSSPWLKL